MINNPLCGFRVGVKFAEEEEEEDEGQDSGLLVELEGKDEKKERETNIWFSKVRPLVLP